MSADSPRRSSGSASRGMVTVPAVVPPQTVSDRSILDSAIGFINEVTLSHQPLTDPRDTITWARFETAADISDPRFGDDWELEGNVAPPLLLILGYGLGVQVWAIPANGEAIEVLSWRHGIVSALRILPTPLSSVTIEENCRADEPTDAFAEKRPLIALVDGSSTSGAQPQFCAVNFVSLKTGTQIKTIQFKNPVIDILANRVSVAITFHERIAVFDARTLEDRLSITTCYPSPGINPNPVALGQRWLAYAENKLLHSKRSGGGCDCDGVASYTATVLNASKSLVKGLRELGEQVAAGLTGTAGSTSSSKNTSFDSGCGVEYKQPGVVTILDVKNFIRDYSPTSGVPISSNQTTGTDSIIAHFIAHSEAIVAMEFDNSGLLLVTADRRGHDFHVFRIQSNPVGPSLAAVHHLYILHRGDTSAKVQNITLSLDSRWVAVSTLRGTTHVFPITPYGGAMGVRTHTSLHVVNKLSRFHRSAGLSAEGRSNSPISHSESTTFTQSLQPYHNPTLPPFPRPTVVIPLAQLRQPFTLGSPPGSATLTGVKSVANVSGAGSQRQRLSSLSDDSGKPLSVCAIFAKSRSWLLDPPNVTREAPHRMQRKAVDSLFVMAGHGALIQYDLDTKLSSNIAREKICDDTPIELVVEAKAQWNLCRHKESAQEIVPPLSSDNWLVKNRNSCMLTDSNRQFDDPDDRSESWLAQVEIVTHAGPHRRLWMGPQFVFKTYNTPSGSNLSHIDIEAVEIGTAKSSTTTTTERLDHSSPLNMPLSRSSAVPVLIESGSYSSIEQSPKLMDRFRHDHLDSDFSLAHGDSRLKEDLADAMRESPSVSSSSKETGGHGCENAGSNDNVAFYDALTAQDDQDYVYARSISAAALANALPNIYSYDNMSSFESLESLKKSKGFIEKIVNPLGTVTTVTSCLTADVKTDILDEVVSQLATEENIIHENCDESLFRPVVAIFCDEKTRIQSEEEARKNSEHCQPPETIRNKLVVPVIPKEIDDEISKKEKKKNNDKKLKIDISKSREIEETKFKRLSSSNKKPSEKEQGNKEKNDENSTHKKSLVLKSNEKQDKKSIEIKNTCENEAKAAIKRSTPPKIEVKAEENSNGAKSIKVESINIFCNEKKCKEGEISMMPKNSDENNLLKMEFKNQTQRSQSVLEGCGMSEIKNSEDNSILKTEDMPINDKNKISSKKQNKTCNDSKSHNTTLETKENVEGNVASNKKENELNKGKTLGKETYEATPESIALKYSKSKSQNSNETKSLCVNKNLKKDKLKKVNTIGKPTKANKTDAEKSEEIDIQDPRHSLLNEIVSNEKLPKCSKPVESNDSDGNNIKDPNISDACNNEKLCNESNSENLILDKKVTIKSSTEDLNADHADSTYKIDKTTKDYNKESQKIKSLKSPPTVRDVVRVSNSVSNSVSDNKAQCESDEKLNKKKSDDNPSKKIDIDFEMQKKSEDKSEQEKFANTEKGNKTKGFLEKQNSSKREAKHDNIEEKSKSVIIKAKQIKADEKKSEENTRTEQKKQDQIALNVKNKEGTKNKSKQEFIEKDIKCDRIDDQKEFVEKANISTVSLPKKEIKENVNDENIEVLSPSNASNANLLDERKKEKDDLLLYNVDKNEKTKLKSSLKGKTDTVNTNNLQKNSMDATQNTPASTSAWKTLSGAEMINKNLSKSRTERNKNPLLETSSISNTNLKTTIWGKLLPELPTSQTDISLNLNEGSIFKPLEALPPLASLEPLQLVSENKSGIIKDISLINFESPTQDNPALQQKITPPPRGFTEQNLIFALCGSLHYENEQMRASSEKVDISPTFSSNRSSTALEEPSTADYKSLTENDDPYMSLEHSSQDTNTTNTNTTNEKFSSSTNSSGSEEVVVVGEKKMTKKQKRKRQQQLQEFQKQKEHHQQEMDDEEFRPLIAMTESQIDQLTSGLLYQALPTPIDENTSNKNLAKQTFLQSTATDSEEPMPATTSDDNVFCVPAPIAHNPHKIKTKKLEHKINLIAAIEAATSSSTSSAEESGVELGGRLQDNEEPLISLTGSKSAALPLSVGTSQAAPGVLKKKSKRRKR